MTPRNLVAALALLLSVPAVARAQQSVDYASVSGRVSDPSEGAVAGARVAARHTETNVVTATVTDGAGRFRLPYLRVGPNEITVSQTGLAETRRALALAVGSAFELPVTLRVAAVDASVTVSRDATVLEAARSQIAGTISQAEIQAVPMNGRNFLELALLVPGVAPANINSTQLFPETSAVPGVRLTVDGLSANDDAAGLSGITYGVDGIEQFQVVASGGQAELGRALGGYVNIVTRGGTIARRGTAYTFVRDDRFNARNALSGTKLPMSQNRIGGSLGGPIAANRTFFFANVEQRRLDQTGLVTVSPATVAAINARLAATGSRGPAVTTGTYPNPVDTTHVFGKVDHTGAARTGAPRRPAVPGAPALGVGHRPGGGGVGGRGLLAGAAAVDAAARAAGGAGHDQRGAGAAAALARTAARRHRRRAAPRRRPAHGNPLPCRRAAEPVQHRLPGGDHGRGGVARPPVGERHRGRVQHRLRLDLRPPSSARVQRSGVRQPRPDAAPLRHVGGAGRRRRPDRPLRQPRVRGPRAARARAGRGQSGGGPQRPTRPGPTSACSCRSSSATG